MHTLWAKVLLLFLAGIVPGVLVGISLMIVVRLMADRYNFPPATSKYSWGEEEKHL